MGFDLIGGIVRRARGDVFGERHVPPLRPPAPARLGRAKPVLAATMALVLCGCGDFAESTGDAPQTTLDRDGGSLTLHAFRLEIPKGAVDHAITLHGHPTGEPGVVGEAFRIEPTELVFFEAATVSIAYDPANYPRPAELFVVHREGAHWAPLSPADQKVGRISGPSHAIGVFGLQHCPASVCPN